MLQEKMLVDGHDQKLLVRVPAAARMLDVSRAKAYAMAAAGQMPGVVRLGGSVRISVEALRNWVREQARTAV